MFKKNHTLHFRNEHIEAIHAILTALGIKVKHYKKCNQNYTVATFGANDKQLMSIISRLDKYGIERAYL